MDTYIAPAERTKNNELVAEVQTINTSPIMSGLLETIGGLLAVVDKNRQIIAINDSFMKMLGIDDPCAALGLRPGEALECIHSGEEQGGCGHSKFCSTCGAAIAMVASLRDNKPSEKLCALTANRKGTNVDIALNVRSQPIEIEGNKFLLLFLKDISVEQQREALEKIFFHDINNMLSGLMGASEILCLEKNSSNLAKKVHQMSLRLKKELDIQKSLSQSANSSYQPLLQEINASQVIEDLQSFFTNHSAAKNKTIKFPANTPPIAFKTDLSLLFRILSNMIINALEASETNSVVKLWVDCNDNFLEFNVWNASSIPDDIALRIFQRNFSTKEGTGRGIGTFFMKFFGEKILAGKVRFTTSRKDGTIFSISLPV